MKDVISLFHRHLINSWQCRDLLKQLTTRGIRLKYRRSFLGYAWSVLNSLLIMIVMAIVFSTMFKRDIENLPVYLLTGQITFNFMNISVRQAIFSIIGNSALLKKTYIPRYTFTVSKITSGLVDFFFSLGALILIMIAIKARLTPHLPLIPFVALQLYVFCIGLGTFLAQANAFFRDIQYIYNAVTTVWMYLAPIFYPIDLLPANVMWMVKHLNPMYSYVGQFHDIVYYGRMSGHIIVFTDCFTAIAMLIIGVRSFLKTQNNFILYI